MFDILDNGFLNADLVVRVPRFPTPGETISGDDLVTVPGGKGANQAVAAAKLGARKHPLRLCLRRTDCDKVWRATFSTNGRRS